MSHARKRRGWKADLLWFLLFLALGQVGLILLLEWRLPELHDVEYGMRLRLLKKRIVEAPARPLCLVVGSSRLTMGFLPEQLPLLRSASGEEVLPFNFGHLGGGPLINLMNLRRLLREGIRPRWVVLEVVPTLMEDQSPWMAVRLSFAADLPLLQRYIDTTTVWGVYLRTRLNPWYSKRLGLLRRYASCLAQDSGDIERIRLKPLGGDDGWIVFTKMDDEEKRRRTASIRASYFEGLQNYHIEPLPDRALRECLDLCRHEGIECVLLVTPESSEYRSWYSADGLECFHRYCDKLCAEYGVPLIDAGTWGADEQFIDGTHLMRGGAEAFTARLGRELFEPLVAGRLHGISDASQKGCRLDASAKRR